MKPRLLSLLAIQVMPGGLTAHSEVGSFTWKPTEHRQ